MKRRKKRTLSSCWDMPFKKIKIKAPTKKELQETLKHYREIIDRLSGENWEYLVREKDQKGWVILVLVSEVVGIILGLSIFLISK